jgi:hypothetical protein
VIGKTLRRWGRDAKRWLTLTKIPSTDKSTGLEEISNENFLWLAANSQPSMEDPGLAWCSRPLGMLSAERINHPALNRFVDFLAPWLRGARVYEIGAADTGTQHEGVLMKRFGVREYRGVDPMPDLDPVVEENDVLGYLTEQPEASGHVLALGLFDNRINLGSFTAPASDLFEARREHYQHEYVRRIVSQLRRIIPPGGILFGDGLGSGKQKSELERYLERAGFVRLLIPERLLELAEAELPPLERRDGPIEPFFFQRMEDESADQS